MNPLQALMRACSHLHDADGKVAVPGFYDAVRPPEPWEREELSKLPTSEDEYAQFLGIPTFHSPRDIRLSKPFAFVRLSNSMGWGADTKVKDQRL